MRASFAPEYRSRISATDDKDSDRHDGENEHKRADPSEPAHSPTHPPSPSIATAHHRCSPSKCSFVRPGRRGTTLLLRRRYTHAKARTVQNCSHRAVGGSLASDLRGGPALQPQPVRAPRPDSRRPLRCGRSRADVERRIAPPAPLHPASARRDPLAPRGKEIVERREHESHIPAPTEGFRQPQEEAWPTLAGC